MKSRKIFPIIAFIMVGTAIFITLSVIVSSANKEYVNEQSQNNDTITSYNITSVADLAIDNSDLKKMFDNSEYVAILTIDSIDGADNYSYINHEYVFPYSFGSATIHNVYKGDFRDNDKIKFYRLGGTLPIDKYREGLGVSEKAKFDQLRKNDPNLESAETITRSFKNDIKIDTGKTYLGFLVKDTTYNGDGLSFIGFEGGIRLIDGEKVLNNFTNEWEPLNDVTNKLQ
ncbi:hypothetical protein IJ765_02770 [Candidatus Saccharibacteria bacterium]|nr:hypothetical protein [Candidatus Saccharibacteria bacterium]